MFSHTCVELRVGITTLLVPHTYFEFTSVHTESMEEGWLHEVFVPGEAETSSNGTEERGLENETEKPRGKSHQKATPNDTEENTSHVDLLHSLSSCPEALPSLVLQRLHHLPRRHHILAAHVTVGSQPLVLRLLQVQVALDAAGAEVEIALHNLAELLVRLA